MRSSIALVLLVAACGSHSAQSSSSSLENQPKPDQPQHVASSAPRVRVRCHFKNGVVALVPQADYISEDYFMEDLIGGYPDENGNPPKERTQACGPEGVILPAPSGRYHLMVGETDTYETHGEYGHNGFDREVDLSGPLEFDLYEKDLTKSFPCISCPHLAAWDGAAFAPRGEVLRDVRGPAMERSERTPIEARVEGRAIRLRLSEDEDEVSHVDALQIEVDGKLIAPDALDLAAADHAYRELHEGDAVELRFPVDLPDGPVSIVVVATGYYVPLAALR
jgi:hypothetical protein